MSFYTYRAKLIFSTTKFKENNSFESRKIKDIKWRSEKIERNYKNY